MSRNDEVASRLEEFADLLEARDVEYKPRSYRQAAENVRDAPRAIEDLVADGRNAVEGIDAVGEAIAGKIVEYVETGEIEELAELREALPVDMAGLTAVEGVGPKTVGSLYEALGITTLDELEAAAEAGEIREVKGFGPKTEQNILENVPFARQARERERLGEARPLADDALAYVEALDAVERAEVAGSIRRWRETVGDVDVLAASEDAGAVVDAFADWDRADSVIEAGTEKASVRATGVRIDLRVVVPEEYGSALQHFTGSWDHNKHLRNVAIECGLKINEYGIFDVSDVDDPESGRRVGEKVGGSHESDIYEALDMATPTPELREDRGEIEAALDDDLPDLLSIDDVRGDLHTHTDWSDGGHSIAEMVEGAAARGYDYHAVTDHATGPGMVGGVGLDDAELEEQAAAVAEVAADAEIELFHGVETNIDAEGGLSTGDDVLADLDIVVASPHAALDQDREAATERLVRAVSHPAVDVLGHPTGRMINSRPGLDPEFERVVEAAVEHDTAIELNANPSRLDARDEFVRLAVEAGATVVIDTDAHSPGEFEHVRYGVHTARRGWAGPGDVLNCRDADGLREFLHRR
jgi:DNA polymerase (family 10)